MSFTLSIILLLSFLLSLRLTRSEIEYENKWQKPSKVLSYGPSCRMNIDVNEMLLHK